MNFETIKQQLFGDDRGVSPVIGVILMVAITVILAAVIGTFVLGLGENVSNDTPRASFSFSDASGSYSSSSDDFVTFSHESGDPVDMSNVKITIRNADNNNLVGTYDGSGWSSPSGVSANFQASKDGGSTAAFATAKVSVGDLVTIQETDSTGLSPGNYKITIIHTSSDSTIASGTVSVS